MKSYLSLIPISAKVHKRKNRMTLFCIILAVLLVTGVFSMADAGVEGEKRLTLSTKGRWHIYIDELSEDNADRIAARSDIAAVSWYQSTNLIRSEKGCIYHPGQSYSSLWDRGTIYQGDDDIL